MKNNNINVVKDSVTIISEGVKLDGKLISKGNVRIDGIINGDIQAEGNITIGEHGEIIGEIKAQVVTIGGKIAGTVVANEKIILESSSKMKGDLITKILVVEEGAVFDGKSAMNIKDKPANLVSTNTLLK
ncbi:MAG: polymer-forming cytoskeletal protein [Ignavibacteriaceae bacterium]|jgi:cytoskeletal protein CcmA (bactofilin family)